MLIALAVSTHVNQVSKIEKEMVEGEGESLCKFVCRSREG